MEKVKKERKKDDNQMAVVTNAFGKKILGSAPALPGPTWRGKLQEGCGCSLGRSLGQSIFLVVKVDQSNNIDTIDGSKM